MFPLATVLFPGVFLPLHVFEPRYRALTKVCLEGDREFGVVLIERGSEVGGGDARTSVGTVAHIVDAQELSDGRWALGAVGTRRFRVARWLRDDPFPRAEVEDWHDPPPSPGALDAYASVRGQLRRVLALKSELAEHVADFDIDLLDDPGLGSFQVSAVAPLGAIDKQNLLAARGIDERLAELAVLLDDEERFLRARLAMG